MDLQLAQPPDFFHSQKSKGGGMDIRIGELSLFNHITI